MLQIILLIFSKSPLETDPSTLKGIELQISQTQIKSLIQKNTDLTLTLLICYYRTFQNPKETFERKITDREWWRTHIKDTPVPGRYNYKDFITESDARPITPTYSFKSKIVGSIDLVIDLLQVTVYLQPLYFINLQPDSKNH